jgi:hypothetical protein
MFQVSKSYLDGNNKTNLLTVKRTGRGHIRDRTKLTIVISAFPGTGKTHYFKNNPSDILILDSDSSKFDKSCFPENYIEHIKSNLGGTDIIFVSSHKVVRDTLREHGINYTLVYPDKSLLGEYVARYKERENAEDFINYVTTNWDNFINELSMESYPTQLVLKSGEFISDYIRVE